MAILITSANSAAAYQLKNMLNDVAIILGDYNDLPEFMVKSGRMIKLPKPSSPSYTHEMLTLCLDKDINTVYALDNAELMLLRESEQLFNEYNITVITP